MTTTKIVCRLLGENDVLLAWCEHWAQLRGDGCLRADGDVTMPVELDGTAVSASLHWVDVNVETRVPLLMQTSPKVKVGEGVTIFRRGDVMITVGQMAGGLPPVTVKSTSIGVPVGTLGAAG